MKRDKIVVVLNHGTRNKQAQEDFVNFINAVREKQPDLRIEYASMELCEPCLPSVIDRLYDEGIRYIIVIPFFLFRGIHITEDIPKIIKGQEASHPGLEIVMGKVLLSDERLQDILLDNIKETI